MSKIYCGNITTSINSFENLTNDITDIRLFQIELSSYYNLVVTFETYLNTEELKHANTFHFEKDKNQFIICRVLLKFILAKFSELSIDEIKIKKDDNKKPFLVSSKVIHFNVSHSKGFAIIGIHNKPIGVDIEYLDKSFDYLDVLTSVYNQKEIDFISKSENKTQSFYKFWTRKESIIKATGEGITDNLKKIPAKDGTHVVKPQLLLGFGHLKVLTFNINNNYITSIAVSGKTLDSNLLYIYNLPNTIEGLLSF